MTKTKQELAYNKLADAWAKEQFLEFAKRTNLRKTIIKNFSGHEVNSIFTFCETIYTCGIGHGVQNHKIFDNFADMVKDET